MQFKFFIIPIKDSVDAEAELNSFLRSHRVLTVKQEFVRDNESSYWSFAVEYLEGKQSSVVNNSIKPKVDYKELLSGEDFSKFCHLRDLRKEIADKDGIHLFAVFSNKQLASMVTGDIKSITDLRRIEGIGEAKASKYAQQFIECLVKHRNKE